MQSKLRIGLLVALVLGVAFVIFSASSVSAQDPTIGRLKLKGNGKFPAGLKSSTSAPAMTALKTAGGKIGVVIELNAASGMDAYNANPDLSDDAKNANVASQLVQVNSDQQQATTTIASAGLGVTLTSRVRMGMNALIGTVDASKVNALKALPGVKHVYKDQHYAPDLTHSVPFIGAPSQWDFGDTGAGVKLAIIDTGVDYKHADFGGNASSTFPTARVVGGTDLVGDAYDGTNTPVPDNDPLDCEGHGSHVAGIAAGNGVLGGAAYNGPYNSGINFGGFDIGPGVAPKASIYAIRVFGCTGDTGSDVLVQAVERALDPNGGGDFSHHVDVINMSIGSPYGDGESDPWEIAVNQAVKAGIAVALSAGNDGDTYYVVGDASAASSAVSVAASASNGVSFDAVNVTAPFTGSDFAVPAEWGGPADGTAGNVVYAQPNTACTPLTNAAAIAGNIAIIDRGTCTFAAKARAATAAGATAVIVVDNRPEDPIVMAGDSVSPPPVGAEMISQVNGGAIESALATSTVHVVFAIGGISGADTLASFSSRGPRVANSDSDIVLKPDISAPGLDIFSALAGSGNKGVTESGTSMASPHIAGVLALMHKEHPNWTPLQLKALLMNTANHDLTSSVSGAVIDAGREGAGRVDVAQARKSDVIAFNTFHPDLVSVSFGAVQTVNPMDDTRLITVENKGNTKVRYHVSFDNVLATPGVKFTVWPTSITVNPHTRETVFVTVHVNFNGVAEPHAPDPSIYLRQSAAVLPRFWMTESTGLVVLRPVSSVQPTLRVPVFVAARPASDVRAKPDKVKLNGATGTANIPMIGKGVFTGNNTPNDVISLMTPSELKYVSPNVADTFSEAEEVAHIHYIGVSSDYPTIQALGGSVADSTVYFSMASYREWSTPSIMQWDILITTSNGGQFILYNTFFTTVSGQGSQTDVHVSELFDLINGTNSLEDFVNGIGPDQVDTNVFNTNVMTLDVPASELGLTDANPDFTFQVTGFFTYFVPPVDQSTVLSYNVAKPVLDLTGGQQFVPLYIDQAGNFPFNFNLNNANPGDTLGILFLHYHNASPNKRADVVQLDSKLLKPHAASPNSGVSPNGGPTFIPPTATPGH